MRNYRTGCINSMFAFAASDECNFPARCCQVLFISDVEQVLRSATRSEYESKAAEYAIPAASRVYCYQCTQWIHPDHIGGKMAFCKRCSCGVVETCISCKASAHGAEECIEDPAVASTIALMGWLGWRRCSKCGYVVEKLDGCDHIM